MFNRDNYHKLSIKRLKNRPNRPGCPTVSRLLLENEHLKAPHATHRQVARDEGRSPTVPRTTKFDAEGPRKCEILPVGRFRIKYNQLKLLKFKFNEYINFQSLRQSLFCWVPSPSFCPFKFRRRAKYAFDVLELPHTITEKSRG